MVHTIHQGEGGEQGDPLMPLLFCVGQHSALEAIQRRLCQSERLLAYLDDVCLVSQPDGARDAHNVAEQELWTHANRTHDASLWQCMCTILGIPVTLCDEMAKATATLPLALGGMGIAKAERSRVAAHWAQERHPAVAELIVGSLTGAPESLCLGAVHAAAQELDVVGFVVPEWAALAGGGQDGNTRLPVVWNATIAQRASCLTSILREGPRCDPRAAQLQEFHSRRLLHPTVLEPALFRVLLQRRLFLLLLLTKRFCRCGCSLLAVRTAGEKGLLAGKHSCQSVQRGRGRVATNLSVRDMDLGVPNAHDNRRLEVVADGLPLFGGVQLAWTPLWCPQFKVTGNRRGELLTGMVWHSNGLAGGKKQHALNSCSQVAGRAWWSWLWRWGDRWSQEARTFVQLLAEALTRSRF